MAFEGSLERIAITTYFEKKKGIKCVKRAFDDKLKKQGKTKQKLVTLS